MTDLIVYSQRCLSCRNKLGYKNAKNFAVANGFSLIVKRTDLSLAYGQEAIINSDLSQPYVFNPINGRSIVLNGDLDTLL